MAAEYRKGNVFRIFDNLDEAADWLLHQGG